MDLKSYPNSNRTFKKGHAGYNVKPIFYKGKYYIARQLANLEESEIGAASIRANILELRKRVENKEVEFCDEEILKCLKRKPKKEASKNLEYKNQKENKRKEK